MKEIVEFKTSEEKVG